MKFKVILLALLLGVSLLLPACSASTAGNSSASVDDSLTYYVDRPLLTIATYSDYLEFINSTDLPENFVCYDDISYLGSFYSFVSLSEVGANDYSNCLYSVIDDNNTRIGLYVSISDDTQEEEPSKNLVQPADLSNLRTLGSEETGDYYFDDICYMYASGMLIGISWEYNTVTYTLMGESAHLFKYPETATTYIGELLDIQDKTSSDLFAILTNTAPQTE